MAHLVAVEHVGQLVGPQLGVCVDAGSGPAHPHLPRGHRLKLKVPLPLGDGVGLLRPEDTHLVPTHVLQAVAGYTHTHTRTGKTRNYQQTKNCP